MCQIFIRADPDLYVTRTRSMRLRGVATSIRLENQFWDVLDEIGTRDGLTLPQLISRLYDELSEAGGGDTTHLLPANFTSFLRVCCGRYMTLQLSGAIPSDTRVPIASLDADRVLASERPRIAANRVA
jgi:predicted DNA-binding ribbon-helix-helix protein